ncbi:hypothetical protein [Ekhidna sp.]|uniref:hypothetical protein n=1 Tax=Ekhidna sp. TaxID=2608089 RepID=UPI003515F7A6
MRIFISIIALGISGITFCQTPLYEFVSFNKSKNIPAKLNSERSAVIFSVPTKKGDFTLLGDHEKLLAELHKGFVTMGVDVILYLNEYDFTASHSSRLAYVDLLSKRRVKNILFVTKEADGISLLMGDFDGSPRLIKDGSEVFFAKESDTYSLLLNVGREVRRADQELMNFLIPEKPNYLQGISIVENTLLKNYPGQLRRSVLAVERFSMLDSTKVTDPEVAQRIKTYNDEVRMKNTELEEIMKTYPYEYVMIDPMSDDELKRNRYQYLLRSAHASAKSVKQMLDYEVLPSETGFVSVIPVMPDQTKVKTIPKDALVYKFYVRQNISKNVHVGEWDADVTWQQALHNMIGNLTQDLNIKN